MSKTSGNGCPPRPQGMRDLFGGSRKALTGREIVPVSNTAGARPERPAARPALAVVLCALGGAAASSEAPFLATALCAAGIAVLGDASWRKKLLASAAALVCSVAFAVPEGVFGVVNAAILAVAGLVVSALLTAGKMGPGASCATVLVLAGVHLGGDAARAALSSTTLPEAVAAAFAVLDRQFADASPTVAADLANLSATLKMVWPSAYAFKALAEFALAYLGTWLAVPRGSRSSGLVARIEDFDAPLWVVAATLADALALAVVTTAVQAPSAVVTALASVAMTARLAFAVQGVAVLWGILRKKGLGPMAVGFVCAFAAFLEIQFFALTAVGFVDVWANFRRLSRGEEPDATTTTPTEHD